MTSLKNSYASQNSSEWDLIVDDSADTIDLATAETADEPEGLVSWLEQAEAEVAHMLAVTGLSSDVIDLDTAEVDMDETFSVEQLLN